MFAKTRRSLAVALTLPAVLAFGACSKPADNNVAAPPTNIAANPANPGTSAGAPTSDAPTTNAAPASGDVKAFVADLKAAGQNIKTAKVSMDMTGAGAGQDMKLTGDMVYDASNPAMHMKMAASGLDMEMLVIGKSIYIKGFPGDPSGQWTKVDDSSSTAKEMVSSSDSMDPAKMFDEFEAAATGVKELGPKTIDGEQMTEYELTIDLSKSKAMKDAAAGMPMKELVYTVAVDKDKHMRRVTFGVGPVTANIKMDNYNEPLEIKAPTGDLPTSKIP